MNSLDRNKTALVAAHRNGDQAAMRALSQEREELKRLAKKASRSTTCKCGLPKSFNSPRCRRCADAIVAAKRSKPKLGNGPRREYNRFSNHQICGCGKVKSESAKTCRECKAKKNVTA